MDISLAKLPWYAQVGVFVVLALAGVYAFYYYYEESVDAEMVTRQMQLVTTRAELSKGYATAKQLPQFRAQVNELQARLESLKNVLPDEKDAADLLRRLQTVATQSNLAIRSFKPAPTVTKQLHVEWPITLEFDGTYHNLASFFDRVGKFTRIINISGLDVKGKDKPERNSTITATCVATTFVLLDKAALDKKAPVKPVTPAAKGA
jgi:type IV pilus assembly protein PilO